MADRGEIPSSGAWPWPAHERDLRRVIPQRVGDDDPRLALLAEHSRLAALVMALVDVIDDEQTDEQIDGVDKVDARMLRIVAGDMLIDSIEERDRALRELGLAVDPD